MTEKFDQQIEKTEGPVLSREQYELMLGMVNKAIERGPGPENDKDDYERHGTREGLEELKKKLENIVNS